MVRFCKFDFFTLGQINECVNSYGKFLIYNLLIFIKDLYEKSELEKVFTFFSFFFAECINYILSIEFPNIFPLRLEHST